LNEKSQLNAEHVAGPADRSAGINQSGPWSARSLPTSADYLSGLTYLLNYGVSTVTRLDYWLMLRQTLALTQMLLDLSRVPHADLRKETAP
jgi:hypothetical protein